jgi:outer membrane protein OmpA-like peptidoglycan-associated protein
VEISASGNAMDASPPEHSKTSSEAISSVMNLGYKAAIGIGALITFGYLFLIGFFPSGLTPGEVIFFVFIAFAFSITYLIVIAYGAVISLWVAHAITYAFRFPHFNPKHLSQHLFADDEPSVSIARFGRYQWQKRLRQGWRNIRFSATRATLEDRHLAPVFLRGWSDFALSVVLCFLFAALAYFSSSIAVAEFVIGAGLAGFLALSLFSIAAQPAASQKEKLVRMIIIAFLPLSVMFIYTRASLFDIVFSSLGIRNEGVSIEIPASETTTIERISEIVKRPLLDCRRPQQDKVLVHTADVLWTGVGEQTLIRFEAHSVQKRTLFATKPKVAYGNLRLETKTIRIIDAQPHIAPCFDLSGDLLFDTGKYEFQASAASKIKELAESIKAIGKPRKILVRGHSDPRQIIFLPDGKKIDNQLLSEKRAAAVASEISTYLKNSAVSIDSEGAGSREPIVKCASDKSVSSYEQNQCNKPNRRVEIRINYMQ